MLIDPEMTVSELISVLETEISEKHQLLMLLRKSATMKRNGTRPQTSLAEATLTKAAKGETVSLAQNAINILRAEGHPIHNPELRKKLTAAGVNMSQKNALSALYTALSRRKKDVFKSDKGWELYEWGEEDSLLPLHR